MRKVLDDLPELPLALYCSIYQIDFDPQAESGSILTPFRATQDVRGREDEVRRLLARSQRLQTMLAQNLGGLRLDFPSVDSALLK